MLVTAESVISVRKGLESGEFNNESSVRQGIVLRFLSECGFDIWDTKIVAPEETNSGGKRPDFIIRSGVGQFAIELKGSNIPIGPRNFQQTLNYVGTLGIRYAILTNGRVWIFLDESMRGKYETREIFRLDIDILSDIEFSHLISMSLEKEIWDEGAFSMRCRRIKQLLNDPESKEDEILMYFSVHNAVARAIYNYTFQTWTVLAGSTAIDRIVNYKTSGKGLSKRRMKFISEGRIIKRDDGLLEYMDDIMYTSQTLAASDISGSHRSWGLTSEGTEIRPWVPDHNSICSRYACTVSGSRRGRS